LYQELRGEAIFEAGADPGSTIKGAVKSNERNIRPSTINRRGEGESISNFGLMERLPEDDLAAVNDGEVDITPYLLTPSVPLLPNNKERRGKKHQRDGLLKGVTNIISHIKEHMFS